MSALASTKRSGRGIARRWVAGAAVLGLALAGGLAPAQPAVAADSDLLLPLPRTHIEPYLVAATGDSLVNFESINDNDTVSVSTDRGAHWKDVAEQLNHAVYAADGIVRYEVSDDAGSVDLFSYDLAAGSAGKTATFPARHLEAVGHDFVVYGTDATEEEDATHFDVAPVNDPGAAAPLILPSHAGTSLEFLVGAGSLGVAVSTAHDSRDRAITGYLDVLSLTGGDSGFAAAVVPGLIDAAIRGNEVSYLAATSSSIQICHRSLESATTWNAPACLTVKTGDYRTAFDGELGAGPGWATLSLWYGDDSYVGAYVADWSTSSPKVRKLSASGSVKMIKLGNSANDLDRPLAVVFTTYTSSARVGYLAKVQANGTLSRFAEWPTGALQPKQLSLSADRIAGADSRSSGTAWQRDIAEPGTEHVLATKANAALVSAGWTAVNGSGGLVLLNHGTQVARLGAWSEVWQLSGPYLFGLAKAKDSKATVLAAGKKVAFAKYDYPMAIFGSRVAVLDTYNWEARVVDVASGKPVAQASIALDYDYNTADLYLWGDTLVVNGQYRDHSTEVLFKDWRTDSQVGRLAFSDRSQVFDVSDGAALVWQEDGPYQLVDLASMTRADLPDTARWSLPVLDGAGRVLYADDAHLVVRQVEDAGSAAPRALWSSAATTFNSWSGDTAPWRLSLDATKALSSGSLVITGNGQPDETVPVDAAADGSLRIPWDGTIADGAAPAGTYAWRLDGFDGLTAIDGTSSVGGEITVTNKPVAYPQATPKIDRTKPATGDVLTADPKSLPKDATPTYTWYRGTKAIVSGVDKQAYTVQAADVGQTLKVKVSIPASSHYLAGSKTSAATSKVAKGTLIKGTVALPADPPQVDVPFVAATDGWGPGEVKPAYQWYRVDTKNKATAISRATSASFTPTGAEKGYRLKVVVTGTKPGYTTTSVASGLSAAVLAGEYSQAPTPVIDGAAEAGRTLTASVGQYLGADGNGVVPSLTYQWYRSKGGVETALKGATKTTYKPVLADLDYTLRVQVVARRSGYADQKGWSDPTDLVVQGD